MTDVPRPRKKRWSKRAVRATAWTAGATAFISALGAFGAAAIPVATDQAASPSAPIRQKVIIRRIVKRIVIVDAAPPAPVRVVSSGGSGSAPAAAPAPAPAPAPSTGGS